MYCIYKVYLVYSTYINCIYIEYKCLYCSLQWPAATTTAVSPHCVWQGICLATPGNDASHIQGCYCGPHNRVACRVANTAVPLVHRHPWGADQWLGRQRYTYSVHRQIGATLSCFYGLFIHGQRWAVHSNYVSHDTVRKLLVSQGSTAGYWPGIPFQRHTGDSRWVGNRASAATQSSLRWNGTWKVQEQGKLMLSYNKYILVKCITLTMHIPCIWSKLKLYVQKILITYTLHMLCISHVYFVYMHYIYHAYTMYIKSI